MVNSQGKVRGTRLTRREFLGASAVALLAAACAPAGGSAPSSQPAPAAGAEKKSGQTYVLKFGSVLAPTEPVLVVANKVAERLKSRTNGQLVMEVFPSAQLGAEKDVIEQARLGAPFMHFSAPAWVAEFGVKEFSILTAPFIANDVNEVKKMVNAPVVKEWNEKLQQTAGLRPLAWNWYFGPRHIISSKGYPTPEALKGIKMRVTPTTLWVETFKALGTTPVTLEWAEVYTALGQGVVDAAEAPLSTLYGSKLHEVKKVITLTSHFNQPGGIIMGEKAFQALPKELQQVLAEEIQKGGDEVAQMTTDLQSDFRKKLADGGATFVDVDMAAYKKAIQPFYQQNIPGLTKDLYDQMQKVIKG